MQIHLQADVEAKADWTNDSSEMKRSGSRAEATRTHRSEAHTRKTPEGRPARRRAEEKDASDESTVLEYSFTVSL